MTSRPDEVAPFAVSRPLGWLISIGGTILLLDQTVFHLEELDAWNVWWNLGGAALVVGILVLTVGGLFLPSRVLIIAWWFLPGVYALLQATWALGYRGSDIDAATPWIWTLEPAMVTLPLLLVRPAASIGISLLLSALPAISALLMWGRVPDAVLGETPEQLGNVVYVAVFIGIHLQLQRLRSLEAEARAQQRRQVRASVRAERQDDFSRLVHDEVLSALSAAMQAEGTPTPTLRSAASRAIAALTRVPDAAGVDETVSTRQVADMLTGAVRAIDVDVAIDLEVDEGVLQREVALAVVGAAAEALRNSLRHAGGSARRTVRVRLGPGGARVVVSDDGVGFDTAAPRTGLGLAGSVERRLSSVGGSATVRSAVGEGTEVDLAWPT